MNEQDKEELVRRCHSLVGSGKTPDSYGDIHGTEPIFIIRPHIVIISNIEAGMFLRYRNTGRKFMNEHWSTIFRNHPDGRISWGYIQRAPEVLDILRRERVLQDLADL